MLNSLSQWLKTLPGIRGFLRARSIDRLTKLGVGLARDGYGVTGISFVSYAPSIVQESIHCVRSIDYLDYLGFYKMEVFIDDLEPLAGGARLKSVTINDCRIMDVEHLKPWLASFPSLIHLQLERSNVTDEMVAQLSSFEYVRELSLVGNPITDAATASLVNMKRLVKLNLAETPISDEALLKLASLPLEHIRLGRTAVTAEGVARFQASLPECKVVWPYL